MAEVQWIKLYLDMFSKPKINKIRRLPDGDKILLFWIMLLATAGKCNAGGMIFITEDVPFTEEDFADEFKLEINTVKLALKAFTELGMISIDEEGFIDISNWEKYQSADKLAEIREKDRERKRIKRAQQKNELSECVRGQSTDSPSIEREEDLEKELLTISLAREKNDQIDLQNDEDGVDPKDKRREYIRGTLGEGLVFMSQEQFNYLLENYSLDEIYHYFEVIKEQIRMGRRYRKTHFQAIIDMAEKDRKKK